MKKLATGASINYFINSQILKIPSRVKWHQAATEAGWWCKTNFFIR